MLEAANIIVQSKGGKVSLRPARLRKKSAAGKQIGRRCLVDTSLPMPLWGNGKRYNGCEMKIIPKNKEKFRSV